MLAGCASVGPDYVPPVTSVAPSWNAPLKGGLTTGEPGRTALAAWWTALDDPRLNGIINRAIAGNLDLKTAAARIREARARRAVARSGFFPTLDATGSATRSRTSAHTGSGTTTNLYSTSFDASWEVDVFGGVRRSVEAATADLEASREDLNDTLVSQIGRASCRERVFRAV
jgi:outer membrane protein TolC